MSHHDLLDVAEALLMAPLEEHPEEFRKFRDETLYAPLEGSVEAKKRAKREAIAAMGIDPSKIRSGMKMSKKVKQVAEDANVKK